MTFNNEIQTLKKEIKLLESKLEFLQSTEDHKEQEVIQEVIQAFKKTFGYTPKVNSDVFTYYKLGYNASQEQQNQVNEFLDNPTTIPEPKVSVFRQKLFDSIKSVFYNPEYEKTHWKLKVDMAVDEVLNLFDEALPSSNVPAYDDSDRGWNTCLELIKNYMERTDD